jgi:hypothetical protein
MNVIAKSALKAVRPYFENEPAEGTSAAAILTRWCF